MIEVSKTPPLVEQGPKKVHTPRLFKSTLRPKAQVFKNLSGFVGDYSKKASIKKYEAPSFILLKLWISESRSLTSFFLCLSDFRAYKCKRKQNGFRTWSLGELR
jgi:hypothetical protein